MAMRKAVITEPEINRVIRSAKKNGVDTVEVRTQGCSILMHLKDPPPPIMQEKHQDASLEDFVKLKL
ncbi:hypothetical protein [Bartonella australis]|uniref:hypothetical protein n=1 Tax=Bartonella australis TaxID=388640 RepID=UPI00034A3772|nr:hypothetical protein [Bartonella australis]